MDKKYYTEPEIVDYGSIAEMTAGRGFRKKFDFHTPTGEDLEHESTGICTKFTHEVGGHCVP